MNKKVSSLSAAKQNQSSGIVYVYECIACGRRFEKSALDTTLEPHKDSNGSPCYGTGKFVETKVKID